MYSSKKRLVIVSPFRFTMFLTVLMMTLVFIITNIITLNLAYGNDIDIDIQEHPNSLTVQHGDTLWSIASDNYKNSNKDIRQIIYLIQQANGKRNANLKVGEYLILPTLD